MSKLIRNPSPDDIEKMQFQYQSEAIPEQPQKGLQDNGKYIVFEDLYFKPENMFSPPKEKHKLIFKYNNIKNIEEERYIYIRRMTAIEEGYFYDIINKKDSSTLDLFNVMNDVINNCVRNNIDILELNIIEKLWLFIHILILSYGEEQEVNLECPYCNKMYDVKINLRNDIDIKFQEEVKFPIEYKLSSYPFDISVFIAPPLLKNEKDYLSSDTDWIKKLSLIIQKIEGTLLNGQPVQQSDYEEIIKNLNKEDVKNIKKLNDEIISSFGIHLDKVKLNFCRNAGCYANETEVEISIPLDFLFLTVFNNI